MIPNDIIPLSPMPNGVSMNTISNDAKDGAKAQPMSEAPRDGTIVRLLINWEGSEGWSPFTDAMQSWTIGGNSLDHTEEDFWQYVGWNWSQDCFIDLRTDEGAPMPIGWLPFDTAHVNYDPSRDAVFGAIDTWLDGPCDDAEELRNAVRAALRTPAQQEEAGPVAVKALEWKTHDGIYCSATTAIGAFEVLEFDPSPGDVLPVRLMGLSSSEYGTWYPTVDDAKTAAQADFERRVLACLHPAPAPIADERATDAVSQVAERMSDDVAFWKETAAVESRARIEAEDGLSKARKALDEIKALDGELNMSNFDHDDVCKLNDAFVQCFQIAAQALDQGSSATVADGTLRAEIERLREGLADPRLAYRVAIARQGQSSTPRCEEPSGWDVALAAEWVGYVRKVLEVERAK